MKPIMKNPVVRILKEIALTLTLIILEEGRRWLEGALRSENSAPVKKWRRISGNG